MNEVISLLVFIAILMAPLFLLSYIIARAYRKWQTKQLRKRIEWEERVKQEVKREYQNR